MKQNSCPLCSGKSYVKITDLNFSWWKNSKKLIRNEKMYTILKCKKCSHTYCVGDYSNYMIKQFYSNPERYAISSKPQIFQDIIKFTLSSLKKINLLKIADFGGADGTFLRILSKNLKLNGQINSLTVCDYRKNKNIKKPIKYFQINLDNLKKLKTKLNFNFVFCIHTLEHLQNPKQFLTNLYSNTNNFFIYIEVPAIEILNIQDSVTVIHPEHIQYFSLENLVKLTSDIGFSIIKSEYVKTQGVPRLKLLAVKNNTSSPISSYLKEKIDFKQSIYDLILAKSRLGKIGLWGIGNEFWQLMKKYPELKNMIKTEKIYLIDTTLKNKIFLNSLIHDPKKISSIIKYIVILPIESYVYNSIKLDAKKLGFENNFILPHNSYN
jgi:hypothetical protein